MTNKQDPLEKLTEKVGGIAVAILLIIVLLVIAAAILLPPIFLICLLVNYIRYKKTDIHNIKKQFALSKYEKAHKDSSLESIIWAQDKLQECDEIIANEGLRRNNNGRLSQRSYRGQEVQGAIDNANSILEKQYPLFNYYSELPEKRYKAARKHYSRSWAFLIALIIWGSIISYNAMFGIDNAEFNDLKSEIKTEILPTHNANNHTTVEPSNEDSLDKFLSENSDFISTSMVAVIPMVITYLIVFLVVFIIFSYKHKKPI